MMLFMKYQTDTLAILMTQVVHAFPAFAMLENPCADVYLHVRQILWGF